MLTLATENGKRIQTQGGADQGLPETKGRSANPSSSRSQRASRSAPPITPHAKPLAEQAFLSFEEELGHEQVELTFAEATRGVLVLGAVGTGKTSAVCLPALARAMSTGCPGLALDAKGEFCAWARGLRSERPERVVMLGPWADCSACNLIAGWSAQKVRGFLGWLASRVSSQDNYWGSEGVVDGVLAWESLRVVRRTDPTLADLFDALSDPQRLCQEIEEAKQEGAFDSVLGAGVWERVEQRAHGAYVFSIFHAGGLNLCGRGAESQETRQQYAWQTARILSSLRKIAETPSLRAAFCGTGAMDWKTMWLERQAMVFLDCPQALFGEACAMANAILRANFRDVIKSLSMREREAHGFGRDKFWVWVCDEFQQIARESSESLSDDDNLWLDSSRAWGVVNVLATQSVSSLRAKIPATADAVIQNCRSLIALPSSDEATIARCEFLAGPQGARVAEALARPTKERAFLHFHGAQRWASGCLAPLRSGHSPFMGARFDLGAARSNEREIAKRPLQAFNGWTQGAPLEGLRTPNAQISPSQWKQLRQEACEALGSLVWIETQETSSEQISPGQSSSQSPSQEGKRPTVSEKGESVNASDLKRALADRGLNWAMELLVLAQWSERDWREILSQLSEEGPVVIAVDASEKSQRVPLQGGTEPDRQDTETTRISAMASENQDRAQQDEATRQTLLHSRITRETNALPVEWLSSVAQTRWFSTTTPALTKPASLNAIEAASKERLPMDRASVLHGLALRSGGRFDGVEGLAEHLSAWASALAAARLGLVRMDASSTSSELQDWKKEWPETALEWVALGWSTDAEATLHRRPPAGATPLASTGRSATSVMSAGPVRQAAGLAGTAQPVKTERASLVKTSHKGREDKKAPERKGQAQNAVEVVATENSPWPAGGPRVEGADTPASMDEAWSEGRQALWRAERDDERFSQ